MSVALFYNPAFLEHDTGDHPENPKRLQAIVAALQHSDRLAYVTTPKSRDATVDEIGLVHTDEHIRTMRELAGKGGGWVDADTYLGNASFDVACACSGRRTDRTRSDSGWEDYFRLLPAQTPGHHATLARAMGFCIFNNAAMVAAKALALGIERVAIVDIDVHHGNGTQDRFYEDPRVLYCSLHQYPHYPGTGHWGEIGCSAGVGATVNVPLPAGSGDAEYRQAWETLVLPVLRRHRPQMVLVSIGFDTHWADPLAGMLLSVAGYAGLIRGLPECAAESCEGRVIFVLEGGYDLKVLPTGVIAGLDILMGANETTDPVGPAPGNRPIDISALLGAYRDVHQIRD